MKFPHGFDFKNCLQFCRAVALENFWKKFGIWKKMGGKEANFASVLRPPIKCRVPIFVPKTLYPNWLKGLRCFSIANESPTFSPTFFINLYLSSFIVVFMITKWYTNFIKLFDWSFLNGDFRIEKKSYDFSDKRAR